MTLAPLMRDQRKVDADHLSLLAKFHFVMAALALAGLGLLFLHWQLMHTMFEHPEAWQTGPQVPPPPKEAFAAFKWFYVFFGLVIVAASAVNAASGWLIQRRRARAFSLVVAGLNCMGFPLATVLGVFTFIVLLRDSVIESYEAAPSATLPSPPGQSA